MMRKLLALSLALLLAPLAVGAQNTPLHKLPAGSYALDDSHASLTWKVSHLGLSYYTARFTKIDATIELNPQDPIKSTVIATIYPASVKTDFPNPKQKDFDAELAKGKDWFNAGKFPEITYVSTHIERTGENTGKIHGKLTLLGITKPLTLDAKFNGAYLKKPFGEVPAMGFSAKAMLKRSDWGFSTYIPAIGDEVELLIEAEFTKTMKK